MVRKLGLKFDADDYKLCYVEGSHDDFTAYFTTQSIKKQWGDDWDDSPYEHNAGEPYLDISRWDVVRVKFDGVFWETPCSRVRNSIYSVEDINGGDVAWLRFAYSKTTAEIYAGTTLREFIDIVRGLGEKIYVDYDLII